jgi:VIT1/CCC1 family predicted Fe2+/Mn2+ transporter
MLTGVAVMPAMPRYLPYGWVFVVAVIAIILLIFIRMYVTGDRSGRRIAHRSRRRAGHRSG